MIWSGSGLSSRSSTLQAAEEAARSAMSRAGLQRAGLVFCFATTEHAAKYPEMLSVIRKVTGCGNLVGCSGAGVLATDGEIENEPGIAVLVMAGDKATAAPFLVGNLHARDREAGREVAALVNPYRQRSSVLVLFPDTLNCNPDELFSGLSDGLGDVPIVGGGAADDGSGKATFQMCGGQVVSNAVAGVLLTGELASSIGVTQACRPIGEVLRVTACEGNVIESLEGRPALEALRAAIGASVSGEFSRLAGSIFLGFPFEDLVMGAAPRRGAYIVRNIIGVDEESGALAVGKPVSRGDLVCFVVRDPLGAREDLKEMLSERSELIPASVPRAGLYFNCCARGAGLYGVQGIDVAFINRAFGSLPVAGFFGFCEIATMAGSARLHNYSGVMTLISEPAEAEGEERLQ